MWIADKWKDYKVLDTCKGEKLEKWGDYILVRPDPQIIWDFGYNHPSWKKVNGHYYRSNKGGGEWKFKDIPKDWIINYGDLKFKLQPFSFKHTGLFPEQATNWDFFMPLIKERKMITGEVKVLNLFAYTGGASIASASVGANVTHVDASKGMVNWAKENASISNMPSDKIRYIVDDCKKFVEREIRRGNTYDAIIMDPPSYGRGPKGEIWKLEETFQELISLAVKLLSNNPLFFLISMYTTGFAPGVMKYIMGEELKGNYKTMEANEVGLFVEESKEVLPCGSSLRVTF